MISPLIKWNHGYDHFIATYGRKTDDIHCELKYTLNLKETSSEYINGHVIDGRQKILKKNYNSFQYICILYIL